jgi:hypothetical protein
MRHSPEVELKSDVSLAGDAWFSDIMKTVVRGRVLSCHMARPAIPVPENVDFNPGR